MQSVNRPLEPRRARAAAVAAAVVTFGVYMWGASRSFGYDASVTVGDFVVTPSLLDPLRRTAVFNNHVLFSLLEHVVYSATGSRSEVVLRVLPAAAGAVAVSLLAYEASRRAGTVAALAAFVVVATNPMFVGNTRDVRGYSLLVLCAVWSTVLLLRAIELSTRRRLILYSLTCAAGLATHLYMALVVMVHIGVALRHGEAGRFRSAWYAAGALGLSTYLGVAEAMFSADRRRVFHASLPTEMLRELLGHADVAVVLLSVVGVFALWSLRANGDVRVVSGIVICEFVLLWAVVKPVDLYPRFFMPVVPAIAVLVAAATRRQPALLGLVVVAAIASVMSLAPGYTKDGVPYRSIARIVDRADARGAIVCALGASGEPLIGYTHQYQVAWDAASLQTCDVATWAVPAFAKSLASDAAQMLPVRRVVDPGGVVFCRTRQLCAG